MSLVAILDADKEGFLRSETSLTQTIGRAARNVRGKVIMYADKITASMRKTIDETNRRRAKQKEYNTLHGIVPHTINKSKQDIFNSTSVADNRKQDPVPYEETEKDQMAADPILDYMSKDDLQKALLQTEKKMLKAAKETEYMEAARLRDELEGIKEKIKAL